MKLKKKRILKAVAVFLLVNMAIEILAPAAAWALTGGPSQPEVQSFEPVGTTEMVDLFTGDFTYNIPLFELPGPDGGYPFNLAYNAGIGMDQEASWVGLGWNLNPGAINRQMRGLPDDFNGDKVTKKMHIKDNVTFGLGASGNLEAFGADFGSAKKHDDGPFSLGIDLFYNNYKGFGYSLSPSLSFSKGLENDMTAGLGLNFSLNSQEGVSAQPSLSLTKSYTNKTKQKMASGKSTATISMGYNSAVGLSSMSLGLSNSKTAFKTKGNRIKAVSRKIGSTSNLSLFSPGYSPSVSMPMTGSNVTLEVKPGGEIFGIFGNLSLKGYYSIQKLKNNDQDIGYNAYGYLNYQNQPDEGPSLLSLSYDSKTMVDFNRENDGVIRKETPYLGSPSMTYDIYSVNGQGISAMYRPYRNDIGVFSDPNQRSVIGGGEVGLDLGGGATVKFGANITGNLAISQSGSWKNKNKVDDIYQFKSDAENGLYKSAQFKAYGEHTLDQKGVTYSDISEDLAAIGGESPVRIKLNKHEADNYLKDHKNRDIAIHQPAEKPTSVNTAIQQLTNGQLTGDNTPGILNVAYYDRINVTPETRNEVQEPLSRGHYATKYAPHHIGAFIANNPDGLRYVYGLPAYNLKKEDVQFSTKRGDQLKEEYPSVPVNGNNLDYKPSGTDKYLSHTTIPAYAHSYLLTGIVGNDYVDVTGDGITEDDLGYWVKFTYAKANDYKWRAPYFGYSHNEAFRTDPLDDKGSYSSGEKETWYLKTAETKTHMAVFSLAERKDARGVKSFPGNKSAFQSQSDFNGTGKMYKLTSVSLYNKNEIERVKGTAANDAPVPIKTVNFEYDYALCRNTPNNSNAYLSGNYPESGKLTLQKVWFSYYGSEKGKLSPYQFDYHEDNPDENPDYNVYQYDRWGNYKPYPADVGSATDWRERRAYNTDNPYVAQEGGVDARAAYDQYAGVWSLKEIKLPSGSKMNIEYEGDDYAYVQDRQAMQMTPIAGIGTIGSNTLNNDKVYFKLKDPVAVAGLDQDAQKEIVRKYLDPETDKLYYKINIQMRTVDENQKDFIAGYATIDQTQPMGLEYETSTNGAYYTHGFFHIQKEKGYHAFSMAAWQHMRTNQPRLAGIGGEVNMNEDPEQENKVQRIKSLGSAFTAVTQALKGFYHFADDKGWGQELDPVSNEKSFIRLVSPDQKKRGGGIRVRQITLSDEWSTMDVNGESSIYGQVYDYATVDEAGREISSGVAAYEPMVGGDENPLRLPEEFKEKLMLRSDNDFYFEYPLNESLYPGPSVGYSKVTVMSLASAAKWKPERIKIPGEWSIDPDYFSRQNTDGSTPKGFYATTGLTVNEFYTAKDFPVVSNSTQMGKTKPPKLWIPIPFLGTITADKMTASQGYVTILNDMHGKQKAVASYAQDINGEIVWEQPVSGVNYHYQFKEASYKPGGLKKLKPVKMLDNTVKTPVFEAGEITGFEDKILGVDHDFIVDMRQNSNVSNEVDVRINVDVIGFAFFSIPVPSVWPSLTHSSKRIRTAVTNKVIHKAGILKSVVATDGLSTVRTDNELWDPQTGEVLMTTVNNNFDEKVYSYNIPAYTKYDRMGAAFQNLGLQFKASLIGVQGTDNYYYPQRDLGDLVDHLVKGDEFIVENGKAVVTYIGKVDGVPRFYSEDSFIGVISAPDSPKNMYLYRSGRRNLLNAKVGNITSLDDPTLPKVRKQYTRRIKAMAYPY